jgi:hypothetical protein
MDAGADLTDALMLDGNAVAGELEELLGFDMTAVMHRCTRCGNRAAMATLLAYTGGPGTVLRCSICREVVIRLVFGVIVYAGEGSGGASPRRCS